MCHLISVVSAYIFGAVRNLKSTLPALLFLLVSSFAVTAQAKVYDFEDGDFTANYRDDDPATSEVDESTLLDGTYTLPVGAFTSFGIAIPNDVKAPTGNVYVPSSNVLSSTSDVAGSSSR